MIFRDRTDAGRQLAERLAGVVGERNLLVLALPRGGVPVAIEIAHALHAQLDVFLVRKLGLPGHEELAMGAIATGGVRVLNQDVIDQAHVSAVAIDNVAAQEQFELERRESAYREARPAIDPRGHTVIVVDDGLATGSTMRAAVVALRQMGTERIVVAVPVASRDVRDSFVPLVDQIVCVATPEPFYAVGAWYDDFSQTTDDEVRDLLRQASLGHAPRGESPVELHDL